LSAIDDPRSDDVASQGEEEPASDDVARPSAEEPAAQDDRDVSAASTEPEASPEIEQASTSDPVESSGVAPQTGESSPVSEQPAAADPPPTGEQPAAADPAPTGEQPAAADLAPAVDPIAVGEQPAAAASAPAEDASKPASKGPVPDTKSKPKAKAKDVVPGADLDPITIGPKRELTAEERARVEAEAAEATLRESRETAGTGDEGADPERRAPISMPADARVRATGKRKRSVARVILRSGDGKMSINERTLENYFPRDHHRTLARQPLLATGYDSSVDVWVRVHGGGITGQADAVRHGIARALCEVDPELRGELKRRGMLTRDAREKERRKAGLKKARKRPQFSKR